MLNRIITWLQKHPLINAVLALAYFIFILFMHHPLVLLSVFIEQNLGIETYNLVVATVFMVLLVGVLYFVFKLLIYNKENRQRKVIYLLTTLALLITHSRFMFDSNIEVIHSFEFSFLAFLIFPFTRRFGAAVFFTLPFMLIDEWYQYILLYPEYNDYFDMNDLLTDTYGCALMMLLMMITGVKGEEIKKPLVKRSEFIGLICFIIMVVVLVNVCIIVPYAGNACPNTLLVMNENLTSEPFWRAHPTHHIYYHVMKPTEGFIAVVLLHLFYLGLDGYTPYK
jgi:hypothetical protein